MTTDGGFRGTLAERLAHHSRARGNDVAFRFLKRLDGGSQEIRWRELHAAAARALGDLAIGARVGLACEESRDFVIGLAACLCAGFVAVPIPVTLSRRSAPRALAIAKAGQLDGLLVSGGLAVPDWFAGAQFGVGKIVPVALPGHGPDLPVARPAPVRPHHLALIQFTSGSTGDPAGIALTHANLYANCVAISETYGLTHASRCLSWLPLYHDMGLVGHVIAPFFAGARSTIMDPLRFLQRPLSWLRLVKDERTTSTSAPNFALELCAKAAAREPIDDIDLGSLTTFVCGGEPVMEATVAKFIATFARAGLSAAAVAPSYGLAEATLVVSSGQNPDGPPHFVRVAARDGGE